MELGELSGPALVERMKGFCRDEWALLAEILAGLVEIERRRLHVEEGSSSLFDFCVHRLGMSEGTAFRRIAAARLAGDFPCLLPPIATGKLHLSGVLLLRRHLTKENAEQLVAEASGLSESELREHLAERFPRAPVPERIQPLSTQGCSAMRPRHPHRHARGPSLCLRRRTSRS